MKNFKKLFYTKEFKILFFFFVLLLFCWPMLSYSNLSNSLGFIKQLFVFWVGTIVAQLFFYLFTRGQK